MLVDRAALVRLADLARRLCPDRRDPEPSTSRRMPSSGSCGGLPQVGPGSGSLWRQVRYILSMPGRPPRPEPVEIDWRQPVYIKDDPLGRELVIEDPDADPVVARVSEKGAPIEYDRNGVPRDAALRMQYQATNEAPRRRKDAEL